MAYDKVIDSAQLDTALAATANAIREKTGNTDPIAWVANKGFADVISLITSGKELVKVGTILSAYQQNTLDIKSTYSKYADITVNDIYLVPDTFTITKDGTITGGTYNLNKTYDASTGILTAWRDSIKGEVGLDFNCDVYICGQSDSGGNNAVKDIIERTAKDLTIPDGVTQIGSYSFFTYTDLETISLPNSLTNIGKYAFYSCSRLGFSLSSLPDGITKIDESAFYDCMSLGLTSLPNGLIEIKNNAFSGCGRLAITTLPSGITTIGDRAFGYCSKLSTITFLGTPSSIYSTAFSKCDNLTTINVPWAEGEVANAPWSAKNATINYNYTGE